MELFLIDGIGPFFREGEGFAPLPRGRLNWSKIPFHHLSQDVDGWEARFRQVRRDLARFADRVSEIGYNAVTLDDLAHLADHPLYESEVRAMTARFRGEFQTLFKILEERGLRIFVTADVLTWSPRVRAAIAGDRRRRHGFLAELIDGFLADFPSVDGIILRIGESDGLDVRGDLRSELTVRSVDDLNSLVRELLPIFEAHERWMVLRTWTVGAYDIGDLIWHRRTFARALRGVDSERFVVSMKFGESDFFRYLPLNRNFFRTNHRKIVEFQARREYEGCGEYPSFVGHDHEEYARQLEQAPNVIGMSVWCQTGGWVPFRRLAFLDGGEGIWTEINSFVTLRICRDRMLVEEAVRDYARRRGIDDWLSLLELLRLSDEVVKDLLYVREYAEQKLFFRRTRIPPLVSALWGDLFINHSVRKLLRHFVRDREGSLRQAESALHKIARMKELAADCALPVEDIEFMEDTFRILAVARRYYLMPFETGVCDEIERLKRRYKKRWPRSRRQRYRIKTDYRPFRLRSRHLGWLLKTLTRRQRGYRVIDHVVTLRVLSLAYRMLRKRRPHWIPKVARRSAMGIDVVFR